jgi:nitrile hydratase
MNGIHDMGGMQGAGPIAPETRETAFHESWEPDVYAIALACLGQGLFNLNEFRFAIERDMSWARYLESGYYEKWLTAEVTLLTEKGIIRREDLEANQKKSTKQAKRAAIAGSTGGPSNLTRRLEEWIRQGDVWTRPTGQTPRFKTGDKIVARVMNPPGHTRLPRYVRGRPGIVERFHGIYVLPDANAMGRGEDPQPLYAVKFAARDVWGEQAGPRDTLCLSLWESYLEPAS